MENNIYQNAINYLAQSLYITPEQLIESYSAQGLAMKYMLFLFVGLAVVMLIITLYVYIREIKTNKNPELFLFPMIIFVIVCLPILFISYDVFLYISDPRAYALNEIMTDIQLWK